MTLQYLWAKFFKKIRGKSVMDSTIHRTAVVHAGCNIINTTLSKYSYCGYDCTIINCHIGAFCSIANSVVIGGAMHPISWVSTSPVFYNEKSSPYKIFYRHNAPKGEITIIKNDVWIGERVLIKPGVTIGNGAVIGMGSVVTKDVDDYAVVAGCPARIIRKRFTEREISSLLDIAWWEFSDDKLLKYAPLFNDPSHFINIITNGDSAL